MREIGHPRLKVSCGLHRFHVADVPGRHEPGTRLVDWQALLRRVRNRGYGGTVGYEYSPLGDSAASLDRIGELWRKAMP